MARDRAANARLFRLVAEVLRAIAAEVFHAGRRVAVQGVPVPEPLLGVGVRRPGGGIPPAPQPPCSLKRPLTQPRARNDQRRASAARRTLLTGGSSSF